MSQAWILGLTDSLELIWQLVILANSVTSRKATSMSGITTPYFPGKLHVIFPARPWWKCLAVNTKAVFDVSYIYFLAPCKPKSGVLKMKTSQSPAPKKRRIPVSSSPPTSPYCCNEKSRDLVSRLLTTSVLESLLSLQNIQSKFRVLST